MSVYMIYIINIIMNFLNVGICVMALRIEYARAVTFEFFCLRQDKGAGHVNNRGACASPRDWYASYCVG